MVRRVRTLEVCAPGVAVCHRCGRIETSASAAVRCTNLPMTRQRDWPYGLGQAGVRCEHAQPYASATGLGPAAPCDRGHLLDHGVDERRYGLRREDRADRHD